MPFKNVSPGVLFSAFLIYGAPFACAQTNTMPAPAATRPARRSGGFVPGQKRPPGDPQEIAHGKALYEVHCRSCHGADLRGGDIGGPNLLRSQVALSDQNGELIVPIIQGSRQASGMPNIGLNEADGKAVAAYVRSILETIGGQGTPPSGIEPATIVVGNAKDGQAYFDTACASCHSPEGDLKGLASKIPDPKTLQNTWMSGGQRRRRSGSAENSDARTPKVTVTLASGEKFEGSLVRIDDFLVTLSMPDGWQKTFRRMGDVPKVEVNDPMKPHRDLWNVITDKQMHDLTAYLVTLK